jgi:MFS family permease
MQLIQAGRYTGYNSTFKKTAMTSSNKNNPLQNAFRNPNFRLLWAGQATSILGDQFSMIAMPWLVLKLTGSDPVALGTVLALGSVPRALFMLLGGAVTDRLSQRMVMLISDILRLASPACWRS